MLGLHFLLKLCITGCFCVCCLAWHVQMPRHIVALKGSCLVIPCSFDYYRNPPVNPNRVVWYQYKSQGYPLVYDDWYPDSVISSFKEKTHVLTDGRSCTLQINPVTWSHHRQTLYPWVDPENVGKGTYAFYDTTVTIEVVDRAPKPNLMVTGDMKVGQSVTVQCIAYHTCSSYPPSLSLNIPLKDHSLRQIGLNDGTSKTILSTVMFVERDQQIVECVVKYTGGATEKTTQTLNAKCSFSPLSITSTTEEFLEGVPSKVTCTASYTCAQNNPTLTWNYGDMEASTNTISSGKAQWKTISTLNFKSAAKDHGNDLTCYADFRGGQRQEASISLRVKRNMKSLGWSFSTPSSVSGMAGSCVVVPCTFTYSHSRPADPKVIWYLYDSKGYSPVYSPNQRMISKYSSRTSLIGSVKDGNCTLKIERLQMSHSQDRVYPWVDKNPITSYHTMGHSFYDQTTQIIVSDHAKEPKLSLIGILRVGEQSRVSCSVQHSCISAPPSLAVSGVSGKDNSRHTMLSDGVWEQRIERVWTVSEDDQRVRCTVSYPGGQKATSETELNVESLPASVPFRVQALSRSCVVIPCSYEKPHELLLTRGIWVKQSGGVVYHNRRSQITDHFKDRTRMVGDLHHGNCSLEIDDIKPFDNGPFCFMAEKGTTKYRFNNSCAFVLMNASPEKPVMTKTLPEATAGSIMMVSCSVTHTCPTRPPEFVWSIAPLTNDVTHTAMKTGVWETTSNISFIVPNGDGQKSVTCTANFRGNKQESNTSHFIVKGSLIHQTRMSIPIIAPVSSLLLIAIILAVVFGVIMCKNRKKLDDSLRPPPCPEKRHSFLFFVFF